MSTDRRRFLKLMGAAPVSVPVAAKEAAAKMGMSGVLGLVGGGGGVPVEEPQSYLDWAKDELRRLTVGEDIQDIREQAKAAARILDPDLAASRSLSPSVAYAIQCERTLACIIAQRKSYLAKRIAESAKKAVGLA